MIVCFLRSVLANAQQVSAILSKSKARVPSASVTKFPSTMCIPMCVHICPEADHLCYLIFVSDLWHGHLRSSSAHLRMNSYTQLSSWLAFSIALRTTASCSCTSDSGAAAGYVVHNYPDRRSVVVSVATLDHDQSGYSTSS